VAAADTVEDVAAADTAAAETDVAAADTAAAETEDIRFVRKLNSFSFFLSF
jgi:hypothetical protein